MVKQQRLFGEQRPHGEFDAGVYAFRNTPEIRTVLGTISNANKRGEYMFADIIEAIGLLKKKWKIETVSEEPSACITVNTALDILNINCRLIGPESTDDITLAKNCLAQMGFAFSPTTLGALQGAIREHWGPYHFFQWWDEAWVK